MEYQIVKWLHILSSTLLFGTGLGSAYYMFFASLTRDPPLVATVVRFVVRADWMFTTPTVIFQPLSGLYLLHLAGYPLSSAWIMWARAASRISAAPICIAGSGIRFPVIACSPAPFHSVLISMLAPAQSGMIPG